MSFRQQGNGGERGRDGPVRNNSSSPYPQGSEQYNERHEGYADDENSINITDDNITDDNDDRMPEGEYSQRIPDILLLCHYCSVAVPPRDETVESQIFADETWEPVRDWLRMHSAADAQAAAEQRDDFGKTALHFACQNSPPRDVIDALIMVSVETVHWPDSLGWLPIHYACAYRASVYVVKKLAEIFPESKTAVDRKGRTPLHFALGTTHPPAVIVLLSSTGAAEYADDNGMLPLHYACAYGATEESLYVLTESHLDAATTMDRVGRTPLHYALSNAGRKTAPVAVRLLLGLDKNLVNSIGGGPLPLQFLAEYAATVKKEDNEQRESVSACMKHLLAEKPTNPPPDFFTALQSLPEFLRERVVVMTTVQDLLNQKIAQRFPTLILMLDFYVQVMVIIAYSVSVNASVEERFATGAATATAATAATNMTDNIFATTISNSTEDDSFNSTTLSAATALIAVNNDDEGKDYLLERWHLALFIGASYFLIREIIQVWSLLALKALHIWAFEPSNWLNMIYIFMIYFWTIHMTYNLMDRETFRVGAAVSVIFIWIKLLAYLRNVLIDFAVFTGGVFHVMRRLAAFLLCLIIILVAFSRMLYTLFQQTPYCQPYRDRLQSASESDYAQFVASVQCEKQELEVWCSGWDAWLAVNTMLLGEVNEMIFDNNRAAIGLFIIFMFLVVILLANVLIAIVTDSYKVIQEQRSAIVFWTNRLDFVAQMDAIANGPWKNRLRRAVGAREVLSIMTPSTSSTSISDKTGENFGKEVWEMLKGIFDDDIEESVLSIEFIFHTVIRILVAFFVIPAWILLGLITAGWVWPPQIRGRVFRGRISKHNSESEREAELRRTQVENLVSEIQVLKEDLLQELAIDRIQVVQMKSLAAERRLEIQGEMKQIKRIVTMLFEQQSST